MNRHSFLFHYHNFIWNLRFKKKRRMCYLNFVPFKVYKKINIKKPIGISDLFCWSRICQELNIAKINEYAGHGMERFSNNVIFEFHNYLLPLRVRCRRHVFTSHFSLYSKFNTSSGVTTQLSYRCVQRVLHPRGSLLFRRASRTPTAYNLRGVRVVGLFAF